MAPREKFAQPEIIVVPHYLLINAHRPHLASADALEVLSEPASTENLTRPDAVDVSAPPAPGSGTTSSVHETNASSNCQHAVTTTDIKQQPITQSSVSFPAARKSEGTATKHIPMEVTQEAIAQPSTTFATISDNGKSTAEPILNPQIAVMLCLIRTVSGRSWLSSKQLISAGTARSRSETWPLGTLSNSWSTR